jgi:hypothetical protein
MANTIRLKRASGSDPGASDLVTGELAVRTDTGKLFTKKDDNSVTEIGVTANAATATKLETARTIAGVSFDGSANISLNNNAITNGAGYITATLTNEQVQDIVGGMLTGNTETGITVTYQDGDGTIDFSVASQTDNNFTNADHTKLDGIESNATADQTAAEIKTLLDSNQLETAQIADDAVTGAKIGHSTVAAVNLQTDAVETAKILNDAVTYAKIQNVSATNRILGRDSSGAGVIEEITPANLRTMLNVADGATNVTNTNQLTNGAGFITATLTNEQVQDIVGGMVSGNTESGITVTYQDSDGTLDFSVASQTDNNFTTTLKNKLDGIASGATNVTNTNQLTNGAGFITSADGGNAATLDSIDSSQFLRSDAADTATGLLTLSGGIAVSGRVSAPNINSLNGGTVTIDFTASNHHAVNLNQNSTLTHTGTSDTIGQSGSIFLTQDGTGSRTLSFNSAYKFAGGTAPSLSTSANATDRLDYVVKASNVIHAVVSLDVK